MNILATILLWFTYFVSLYFAVFWLIVFLAREEKEKIPQLQQFPFVTITIPAYNEEDSLAATMQSVLALDYPKEQYELIVVDDGSTDATAKIVSEIIQKNKEIDIQLLQQQNKGKGAALNNALRQAKGDYFVCLDADSFVESMALKKMLPHFREENVAAVLPFLKIYNPQKTLEKLQWYEYLVNMFYKELMGIVNCVHVTPGPFSIYRAETLRKIGYFDEHNLTEDLEIALRLQWHHYKIIQLVDAEVHTIGPTTLKDLYLQRNRWFKGATLNAIKYRRMLFNKNYGDFGFMQMPTILLSGLIAIILLATFLYSTIKPYVQTAWYLELIRFDILPFLTHLQWDFSFMDLNYITVFVAITMLCISLYIMKKAETGAKENILKYGFFSILVYLFFYFLFLGAVWVGVFFDILRRRKQQW